MKKRLTKITLNSRPPRSGRLEIRDTDSPLTYRLTSGGLRSFSIRARGWNPERKDKTGKTVPGISQFRIEYPDAATIDNLPDAQAWAHRLMAAAKRGDDPRPCEPETEAPAADLFEDVAATFIERDAKPNNRSWRETERIFEADITPKFRGREISSLRRREVAGLLDEIEDRTSPYSANRALAALRKLCNWYATRDDDFISPIVPGMSRRGEAPRTRTLTDDELRDVWNAFDQMPYPWGEYHKILLLTGQRKMEVANLRRSHVVDGVWTMPPSMNKAKRLHTVPLPTTARAILDDLLAIDGIDLYFISGRVGDAPLRGFGRAKIEADKLSGVDSWRLHDLRRSMGDWMKRAGIDLMTRKACLNHSPKGVEGVTSVYSPSEHAMDEPKRRAFEAWALHVAAVVDGGEAKSNVTPIMNATTEAAA